MRFIGFLHKRLLSLFCIAAAVLAVLFWIVPPVVLSTLADTPRFQEPVCRVDTKEKQIALTFDVEWTDVQTDELLNILKKYQATATFFVVGHFLESAPELVKRMVTEGHTVGNHTYHHPDMSAISDKESFQKELDAVSSLFQEVTGQEMTKYYRPPQGKYSTENLAMAKELGYKTFFWSLAYVDWNADAQPTEEEAYGKLIGRIHPGAIVLLHNTSSTNGKILDELLTRWEDMGYTFRPLSCLWEHD